MEHIVTCGPWIQDHIGHVQVHHLLECVHDGKRITPQPRAICITV
jgi:hypothetical protein